MILPGYPARGQPLSEVWGRRVVDCLRSLIPHGSNGVRVIQTPGGTTFISTRSRGGGGCDPAPFDWSLAGTSLTVAAGRFVIHGRVDLPVTETAITLAGSEEWIYVEWARGASTATISQMSTRPVTDANVIRVPIYRFTGDGSSYSLVARLHWGDIHLGAPLL